MSSGCWARRLHDLLKEGGLRATRQRVALAALLFRGADRHVTAEELHREAVDAGVKLSLATVYNTLNQFKRCGLLRVIPMSSTKVYFDTNTADHDHMYFEDEDELVDICVLPGGVLASYVLDKVDILNIDVIVRARKRFYK